MLLGYISLLAALGLKEKAVLGLGIAFVCLIIVNGSLLAFRPDLFLRFYDWQNPGDYWGRSASWRKDVHNAGYKVLGVVLLISGFLFLGLLVKVLRGARG